MNRDIFTYKRSSFTNNTLKKTMTAAMIFALAFLGFGFVLTGGAQAQTRVNDRQVERIIQSIERRSDAFRRSFDAALDRSRFNNTNREDNINEFVKDYENETDMLRRKFDDRTSVAADASNLLVRAARIDDFMRRNLRRETAAQRDWTNLRADLNQLANYYNLAFNLDNRRNLPAYIAMNNGAIIGGGKGAAIGAGIGAGAGAGSIFVQGRDDLELQNGAQFTIRASAPRTY
jgi:hypothetical protein